MQLFVDVITIVVSSFTQIMVLLMFGRICILLLPIGEDSAIANFLYGVTEPFVIPVRMIIERFGWAQNTPIDIAVFVSMLMLFFIQTLLQPVII